MVPAELPINHLLTAAVAIQNVIDLSRAVRALIAEGYPVKYEDLATLSPYQTRHIKRFGDYVSMVTTAAAMSKWLMKKSGRPLLKTRTWMSGSSLRSTTISCNRITVSGTIRFAGAFENVIVAILGVGRSTLMVLCWGHRAFLSVVIVASSRAAAGYPLVISPGEEEDEGPRA